MRETGRVPRQNASHCRGQQPGPSPPLVRAAIDGGQLIAGLAPGQGTAAGRVPLRQLGSEHSRNDTRATGGVPLMHFGSVQLCGDTAAGGTPLTQAGVVQEAGAATGGGPPPQCGEPVQALAAVAARLSEPTVRTAESTAPAITRLMQIFGMAGPSGSASMGPTLAQVADATLKRAEPITSSDTRFS
jgi:hypothetical protein